MVPFDLPRRVYGVDTVANIRAVRGFLYSTNGHREEMIHPRPSAGIPPSTRIQTMSARCLDRFGSENRTCNP